MSRKKAGLTAGPKNLSDTGWQFSHHARDVEKKIRQLRALERYIGPIIAEGVFNNNEELWSALVDELAAKDYAGLEAQFQALFQRLETAEPGSTLLRTPQPDNPQETTHARDALMTYGICWGDAGFLVGLAVGMQLGPHAFDGGRR